MFSRSLESELARPSNQALRISESSAWEVWRRLSASTLASLHCLAPDAVWAYAAATTGSRPSTTDGSLSSSAHSHSRP
jgi:hypothetical protein